MPVNHIFFDVRIINNSPVHDIGKFVIIIVNFERIMLFVGQFDNFFIYLWTMLNILCRYHFCFSSTGDG